MFNNEHVSCSLFWEYCANDTRSGIKAIVDCLLLGSSRGSPDTNIWVKWFIWEVTPGSTGREGKWGKEGRERLKNAWISGLPLLALAGKFMCRLQYVSGVPVSGLRSWGIYSLTPIHYRVKVVLRAVTWLLNQATPVARESPPSPKWLQKEDGHVLKGKYAETGADTETQLQIALCLPLVYKA